MSIAEKVTIGTCNLASVILKFTESPGLEKTQSLIQFNSRLILLLTDGISNDLQTLLKYFHGTTIFVFFTELVVLLTAFAVFPTRTALYLND